MTAGVLKPFEPVVKGGQYMGYARPRYVNSLSFTGHEEFTVPAGAKLVVLTGTIDFYVMFNALDTAAVATDITDGSASTLVPAGKRTLFALDGIEYISVAAAAGCIATAEFFK